MPIPSWYRRNEKLIDQANSAINILLLAHYGIDKDPRQKEIAERGMRAVLASERDWPSAVIAFKEIEKSINEDYEKALKTRKNIPLHQSNKDDLVKIKRQFGVK
ncbi:MAG: hypothetical protein LBG48_03125 [Rickettsiales bacterium]|nr:hypothetical protein [Rickettsiales bacterium]